MDMQQKLRLQNELTKPGKEEEGEMGHGDN